MKKYEKVKDIQLKYIGEDYITISLRYDYDKKSKEHFVEANLFEVEIDGIEASIIMALGLALQKDSFLELSK